MVIMFGGQGSQWITSFSRLPDHPFRRCTFHQFTDDLGLTVVGNPVHHLDNNEFLLKHFISFHDKEVIDKQDRLCVIIGNVPYLQYQHALLRYSGDASHILLATRFGRPV